MLIKICGITNEQEIDAINELKPDYIGFVFAESKRKVSIELAKKLYKNLNKNIKVVGVFRNNSEKEIIDVLDEIPLDVIQLHGDEGEELIRSLKSKLQCDVWKAVSISEKNDLIRALNYTVDTIVLDGNNPGSGRIFPWEVLEGVVVNKRVFLAGGINEENVLEAIEKVNPIGIDTSSGVEIVDDKGRRKSKEKMKRLIKKVRFM